MLTLRMLGGIALSGESGEEIDALLRQPKHIALLAYLTMPMPGTWHRRDALVAAFWPELDQSRARTALRSALHTLRRHLPDGAIRTCGDEEVGVDPAIITTDVAALTENLDAGRHESVLAEYRGELLPALHLSDAEGFEVWLERERTHIRSMARKAASLLRDGRQKSGDLPGAIDAARHATDLNPDDESVARELIVLLDRVGDRAQAIAVFDRLRRRLSEEFGSRPSVETETLIAKVKGRDHLAVPTLHRKPQSASTSPPTIPVTPQPTARASHPRAWLAIATLAAAAAIVVLLLRPGERPVRAATTRMVVVLPAENETGDAKQDYIATGIAEGIAMRLEALGPFTIRSGARSEWPVGTRHDFKTIGREFGATVLLHTTLARVGDSLEVRAAVVDATTSAERSVAARRFSTAQLRDVESNLTAMVAAAVSGVQDPAIPRPTADRTIDPESYRLMLEGWHQLLSLQNVSQAKDLFQRAVTIDAGNARAWSGLSSAFSAQLTSGALPFDVAYDRASAAAARALALDSLQGTALANLGYVRALKYRSLAIGEELIRKAAAAEPGNAEVFLVQTVLYRLAHQWDRARDAIRVAHALDPLNSLYAEREGFVELCADQPEKALPVLQAELLANPSNAMAQGAMTRTMARLGRYRDAIASWRVEAKLAGDASLGGTLASVHDSIGFWTVRHALGRERLAKVQKAAKSGWVAPQQIVLAQFGAGDIEGGYAALNIPDPSGRRFHLPCLPAADEVRRTKRFADAIARAGALPLR